MTYFTTLISPHIFEKILLDDLDYVGQLSIALRNLDKYTTIIVTQNLKKSYRAYKTYVLGMPPCPARKTIITFFETRLMTVEPRVSGNEELRQPPHQGCAELENVSLMRLLPPLVVLLADERCNVDKCAESVTPSNFGNSHVYQTFLDGESLEAIEGRSKSAIGTSTWEKLDPFSKTLLVAGQHDWESRRDMPDMVFSPVINSFANVLENELTVISKEWKPESIYSPQYLKHSNVSTQLLAKFVSTGKGLSIGNYPYLFDLDTLFGNPLIESWKKFLLDHDNSTFITSRSCINSLKSAQYYRNKADHPYTVTKKDCEKFLILLIGNGKKPGLLKKLI